MRSRRTVGSGFPRRRTGRLGSSMGRLRSTESEPLSDLDALADAVVDFFWSAFAASGAAVLPAFCWSAVEEADFPEAGVAGVLSVELAGSGLSDLRCSFGGSSF